MPETVQHNQLAFAPKVTSEGTESPADTTVIHQEIVPHNESMSPPLDSNGVEELNQGNPREKRKRYVIHILVSVYILLHFTCLQHFFVFEMNPGKRLHTKMKRAEAANVTRVNA